MEVQYNIRDILITYRSEVLPSIRYESEIEVSLYRKDEQWLVEGRFGTFYDQDDATISLQIDEAAKLLAPLMKPQVPAIPVGIMGLDGTTNTVTIRYL